MNKQPKSRKAKHSNQPTLSKESVTALLHSRDLGATVTYKFVSERYDIRTEETYNVTSTLSQPLGRDIWKDENNRMRSSHDVIKIIRTQAHDLGATSFSIE